MDEGGMAETVTADAGDGRAPDSGTAGVTPRRRGKGLVEAAPRRGKAKKRRGRVIKVIMRWSREREERFLESLGATPNIAEALRVSGLSDRSVRRRRDACALFRAKWLAALRASYARLEADLLMRAIDGTEKPVWYGGKEVGTIRDYNDRIGLALLRMHRETVSGTKPLIEPEPVEAARARLAAHQRGHRGTERRQRRRRRIARGADRNNRRAAERRIDRAIIIFAAMQPGAHY